MKGNPAEEFFHELLPYLEKLDAQIGALIQVLRDKGVTTPEEFARYVEQADLASDVRDRGRLLKECIRTLRHEQPWQIRLAIVIRKRNVGS